MFGVSAFLGQQHLARADHAKPVLFLSENPVEVLRVVIVIHVLDGLVHEFLELLGFVRQLVLVQLGCEVLFLAWVEDVEVYLVVLVVFALHVVVGNIFAA